MDNPDLSTREIRMANVALGNHYEDFVKRQVESGQYSDASEVVRAGLQMLEDHQAAHEAWLREDIPSRHQELVADPTRGIPAETVRARFEAKHKARLASGME